MMRLLVSSKLAELLLTLPSPSIRSLLEIALIPTAALKSTRSFPYERVPIPDLVQAGVEPGSHLGPDVVGRVAEDDRPVQLSRVVAVEDVRR
jgi:hypothetical protein